MPNLDASNGAALTGPSCVDIFRPVQVSTSSTSFHRRTAPELAAIEASLVDLDTAAELASLFRLLGDPTRVRILMALHDAEELCVCDLAAVVGTSETKVSQGLRLLRTAGVVRNRREGRNIHYRLDDDHVRTLLTVSAEHLEHMLPTSADTP